MNPLTIVNALKAWVTKFFAKKEDLSEISGALAETAKTANAGAKAVSNIKTRMQRFNNQLMNLDDYISLVDSRKMDSYYPRGTGSLSMNASYSNPAGYNAVAVGGMCSATGSYSFAEGNSTHAIGVASHAEGNGTYAIGDESHAEGYGTYAHNRNTHVQGMYNVRPSSEYPSTIYNWNYDNDYVTGNVVRYQNNLYIAYTNIRGDQDAMRYPPGTNGSGWYKLYIDDGDYAFVIGNGGSAGNFTSPANKKTPSNAHTVDWYGNAWFAGDVYVKSTSGSIKDEGSEKLLTETDVLQILRDKGLIE